MAITFRTKTEALQTGWGVETTEGTAVAVTSANFVGDYTAELIQPNYETQEIKAGGSVGTDKMVQGKMRGELSSFRIPVANGSEGPLLKSVGGYLSGTNYYFGGDIYSNISGSDKGRISTTSITFVQYDGLEKYTLVGSRPATMKISAKNGEVVYLDSSFSGNWSKANSTIAFFQKQTSAFNQNGLKGSPLTIAGTSFDYTEIELDFKPKLTSVESAASGSGYAAFEIVDIDPTFTISVYPGDPSIKDLWTMFATNAPIPFSWSFGSGAGNTYTITANIQIQSQERIYSNDIQEAKIVFKPVTNPAQPYKLAISIS